MATRPKRRSFNRLTSRSAAGIYFTSKNSRSPSIKRPLVVRPFQEPLIVFADQAENVALFGLDVPFFPRPEVFPPLAGNAERPGGTDDARVETVVADRGGLP